MTEDKIEFNSSNEISAYNGSAFVGAKGGWVPLSATDVAIGSAVTAVYRSFVQGVNNMATGYSFAQGENNSAMPGNAFCQGTRNYANSRAFCQGDANSAVNQSFCIGYANSGLTEGIAIGQGNTAYIDATSLGTYNYSYNDSLCDGVKNSASFRSICIGGYNLADRNGISIGLSSNASQNTLTVGESNSGSLNSISVGYQNKSNSRALTLGQENFAETNSISLGESNTASYNSYAVGDSNLAAPQAFAHGYNNSASIYSMSLGYGNNSYNGSLALGSFNDSRQYSLVQGANNKAINYSVAVGNANEVKDFATAFGNGLTAESGSFVIGNFNSNDSAAFIVSNGVMDNETGIITKADAFIVEKDGRVSAANDVSSNLDSINNLHNLIQTNSASWGGGSTSQNVKLIYHIHRYYNPNQSDDYTSFEIINPKEVATIKLSGRMGTNDTIGYDIADKNGYGISSTQFAWTPTYWDSMSEQYTYHTVSAEIPVGYFNHFQNTTPFLGVNELSAQIDANNTLVLSYDRLYFNGTRNGQASGCLLNASAVIGENYNESYGDWSSFSGESTHYNNRNYIDVGPINEYNEYGWDYSAKFVDSEDDIDNKVDISAYKELKDNFAALSSLFATYSGQWLIANS